MSNCNINVANAPHRVPDDDSGSEGALAADSFAFSERLAAVARELGISGLDNLSDRDRRRLIQAIFVPRVAPDSVEPAP